MRALVIDDVAKRNVQLVLDYAQKPERYYRIGQDGLQKSDPPGNFAEYVAVLPDSYRCVFSYTKDERDGKLWRHLSISVPGSLYPNPYAAYTIAELFGFTGWDQKSSDFPDDWMLDINRVDRCITLLQEVL
jgi:hypothetical protein